MTRLRPANIRQTSNKLCYPYDGISKVYYTDQLKQNLANANALKTLGQTLTLPTTPFKRGKLHTLQPASLPMGIQLRTQKTMRVILVHSRHWFLNKAQAFASVIMPSTIQKVFQTMAGFKPEIPKSIGLENAMFAATKNFKYGFDENSRHVHMSKKQGLTKHTSRKLNKVYSTKACDINKPYSPYSNAYDKTYSNKKNFSDKNKRLNFTHGVLKRNLFGFLKRHNLTVYLEGDQNPYLDHRSNLNLWPVLKFSLSRVSPYGCFCAFDQRHRLTYKHMQPLLHPSRLTPKFSFKPHPKQTFMRFAFAYLGAKTYDGASKRFFGPRLAAMHVEKSNLRGRKKSAHRYDFQFLRQLNNQSQLKFGFVSPLSKLSQVKKKAKDPWLMLSSSSTFYNSNRKKQEVIVQPNSGFVDTTNALFKTKDVPQKLHLDHSVDVSKTEQKAIDTVNPRFITLGRFNRPLKLCLFAFIAGKFPMGIRQGYRLDKRKIRRKAYRKSKQKHYKTRKSAKTNLKLKPFNTYLRHNDVLKVALSRLNTALRFELTLNLEQMKKPVSLRSTLSVRL